MIARTWGMDRRLEAMLGHGQEMPTGGQVGSSAMAHKSNPIYAERMVALSNTIIGMLPAFTIADEWLEGDIAASAQRRRIWPELFRLAETLCNTWMDQLERWHPYVEDAMRQDLERHASEACTGAYLQYLVEQDIPRSRAHEAIMKAWRDLGRHATTKTFRMAVCNAAGIAWDTHDQPMQRLMNRVLTQPPGIAVQICRQVALRAGLTEQDLPRAGLAGR
jgi:adenylosuccinate lyase